MCPKNYMNFPFIWYKNLGRAFIRFVTIHACDGGTDGRTDTFAVEKTALHICSALKTVRKSSKYLEKLNNSCQTGISVQFDKYIIDLLTLWCPRSIEVQHY